MKLTPAHDLPVYAKNLPLLIHLMDGVLVEIALMQSYGLVTLSSNFQFGSSTVEQRKPSGNRRRLIDLRRVNHLLRSDYRNNTFPISNMTCISSFCRKYILYRSRFLQAYHCVQWAQSYQPNYYPSVLTREHTPTQD